LFWYVINVLYEKIVLCVYVEIGENYEPLGGLRVFTPPESCYFAWIRGSKKLEFYILPIEYFIVRI